MRHVSRYVTFIYNRYLIIKLLRVNCKAKYNSKDTKITVLIKTDFRPNNFRRSLPEVFCKNGVLRNFAKFTGKHLCQRLFLNEVAGLRPATLLKKRH